MKKWIWLTPLVLYVVGGFLYFGLAAFLDRVSHLDNYDSSILLVMWLVGMAGITLVSLFLLIETLVTYKKSRGWSQLGVLLLIAIPLTFIFALVNLVVSLWIRGPQVDPHASFALLDLTPSVMLVGLYVFTLIVHSKYHVDRGVSLLAKSVMMIMLSFTSMIGGPSVLLVLLFFAQQGRASL